MPNADRRPGDHDDYIEVWNDLVSTRDLTWSLLICGVTTAAALAVATLLSSSEFFWGLGGAVVGFVICVAVFTPKRTVRITDGTAGTTVGPNDTTAGESGDPA
ncbi:hypothetical protein [Corynebacterium glyciniphilum]|uniref:hypothetical protein n=1 Tax=Corynebacterium glyciniphilum TaxID=1404244 RepID=UPI002652E14D|nr:hypothetical protein [Corynebacterium glyciniphilum]MDN5682309.1 hypothetical protein [Corynebacterium glyciniphilum]MDN6705245.1 hypothetical protein [Corynebacterium glyciniphilum]